jgi:hypothetical protein
MGHTRKTITTLLVLLIPAGAGIVTVHASPTCQRYVRTYVSVPIRNKVSKATAIAWAKWRKAHPGWKPNPQVHRPMYRMSRREQIEKVAFACEVPSDPKYMDTIFTPSDLHPPAGNVLPPISSPRAAIETADLTFPGDLPPVTPDTPPYTGSSTPSFPGEPALVPPFVPPVFGPPPPYGGISQTPPPPPPTPVPEPSSWLLAFTAVAGAELMRRRVDPDPLPAR